MESSLFSAVLLPPALALVMLGMGLSLEAQDFSRILRAPQAVAVGSLCQEVALPLIALLLVRLLPCRR